MRWLCLVLLFVASNADAYTPPIGIPDPGATWEGGLHPIDTPVPAQPAGWPGAEVAHYYYIDNSDSNCTNSNNTYGYPNKPRCTLVTNNGTFPAGTYVEFHGEPTNTMQLTFQCTAQEPCWIIGRPGDRPVFTGMKNEEYPGDGRFGLVNSSYVFIDGLEFAHKYAGGINVINTGDGETHHISVRNCLVRDYTFVARGSCLAASARDTGSVHDIVFYKNIGRHLGDFDVSDDPDIHLSTFSLRHGNDPAVAHHLYFLENELYDSCGSILQMNGGVGGQYKLHHLYVGKNIGRRNKQRIIAVKQSSHVIVSQNDTVAFNQHWLDEGGVTDPFGWALSPDYVWFIFNKAYNASDGWRTGDSSGGAAADTRIYIIGNEIYNIKPHDKMSPHNPDNEWRYGQGVHLKNGRSDVYIVDNTFYNCYGGVSSRASDNPTHIYGNIFYDIYHGDTFIAYQNLAGAEMTGRQSDYNVFFDPDGDQQWRWKSNNYTTLADWRSVTGHDTHSQLADPQFVDGSAYDFHLQSSSPAKNINKSPRDVYALFYKLYGIDIRKDFDGNVRPQGAEWDDGAFESSYSVGPVRSHGLPLGAQDDGTNSVTMSLYTDVSSTCKYSTTAGVAYADMPDTFSSTGGTDHQQSLTGLTDGSEYNYYIRCSDGTTDNDVDYKINFRVEAVDTTPPVIHYYSPQGAIPLNHYTSNVDLFLSTDDVAECRTSLSSGVSFDDMDIMPATNNNAHYLFRIPQNHGTTYTYYTKCKNEDGFISDDYVVQWTQAVDPDSIGPYRTNTTASSQPSGTNPTVMTVTTDVAATCHYSLSSGTAYDSMAGTFSTTGGTSHSQDIPTADGQSYTYYVRCTDGTDTNDTDLVVSWSVESAAVCDSSHLSLCTDQSSCEGASGHWCDGVCQSAVCGVTTINCGTSPNSH